jgi:NAD(P)-dependent dehydrogenase (short-subunit alcohol dehydrogenase family)
MKQALIWGASGGIGKALTQKLADEDYTVVAVSRNPEATTTLTPYCIAADFSQPEQIQQAANQARAVSDSMDLFIYASGDIASIKATDMTLDDWNRILTSNLTGAFLAAQASLPLLARTAPMVFIGAVHERLRLPGLSAYAAAKAGLEAFAESLRKETRRPTLIVRPSAVNTPFWSKVPFSMPKNAAQPDVLAEQIYTALQDGKSGLLDL